MKKYRIGYTQGVYDMFHIGHLNLINHAKEQCDVLVVGVNKDSLVRQYKNKDTVIDELSRKTIIENLKAVDECFLIDTLDKVELYHKIHFDAIFIGSDWQGNSRWRQTEIDLAKYGVEVVYLPYTKNISSTLLKLEKGKEVDE